MSARTVAAIFDADNSRYVRKVLEMRTATKAMAKEVSASAVKNKADWDRVGGGLLTTGALMAGGLAAVTVAAMGWESAWAGVKKTVDTNDAGFVTLEGDLRQLARTMASSHEEIATVAENAGALGVKTKDVAQFTRTMLMLGETTNLSADEASTSLAQLMTIMGTAPGMVGRLGATLVDLGNNGASTEKQIVELSQRLAGAARAVGLNEAALMGYSSAIASTGMNVEAGGSAMSKVFIKLERITTSGGAKLTALNEMTGTDFKQAFEQDAAGAVQTLIESLGQVQAAGGSVTQTLDDLGIKGIYETDVIRRLAGSGTLLAEQLGIANKAMSQGSALLVEYQKRAETSESKVKVAWNNIKDSAIDAGQAMLPMLAGGAEQVAGFVHAWQQLPAPVQSSATNIALAAAAGSLILGGGMKVVGVVSSMAEAYANLAVSSPKAAAGLKAAGLAGLAIGAVTIALQAYGAAIDAAAEVSRTKSADIAKGILEAFGQGRTYDLKFDIPLNVIPAIDDPMNSRAITTTKDALKHAFSDDWGQGLTEGFQGLLTGTSATKQIMAQLTEYDKGLADLAASGNAEAAAAGFRQIAQDAADANIPLERILPTFDDYRSQLDIVAEGLGLKGKISEGEFVKWMGGEIPAAVRTATAAGGPLVDNLTDQQKAFAGAGGAASTAADDVATYTAALWGAANAALKLSGTKIGFETAIDDTGATIKGNSKKRGKGTKVGNSTSMNFEVNRENKTALDELAASTQAYVNTLIEQDAGVGKVTGVMERARTKYVEAAIAAGYGAEEANRMADEMGLIPSNVQATIETSLNEQAMTNWKKYHPGSKTAWITPKLTKTTLNAKVVYHMKGGPGFTADADGGLHEWAGGHLLRKFKDGGFAGMPSIGSQQPQIQPNRGPNGIVWAETGAGPWEAFISGHPAKQDRSRGIATETVSRLGGDVVWRNADGGIRDYQQIAASSGRGVAVTLHSVVNYPVAEPASVSKNRDLQSAAAVGRFL